MKTSTFASLVLSLGMLVACGGSVSLGSNGGQLKKGDKCTTCEGGVNLDAKVCPGGSAIGRECLSRGDGTCGYDFPECPGGDPGAVGTACGTCNGPMREDARTCSNGQTYGRQCLWKIDGTCDWEFPACPGDCSAAGACGNDPVPDIARVCADGTSVGYTCNLQTNGTCGYSFACPGDACQDVECGFVPPVVPCETAPVETKCVRGAGGKCAWKVSECPARDGGAAPDAN